MPEPETPKADPATVAWGQAHQYLDRLCDALERLDEAGGIRAAAAAGNWSPKAWRKAEASMEATLNEIVRQLEQFHGGGGGGRSGGRPR